MKEINVSLPFFINRENMEYYLKGYKINNLEEIHNTLFKDGMNLDVYEPRISDPNHPDRLSEYESEYPNQSDVIKAKVIRYIKNNAGEDRLEVNIIDSLYYFKLKEPCIKLNGYCTIMDDNKIHIDKITRITLADRNSFGVIDCI